jgi:hypothetical protein
MQNCRLGIEPARRAITNSGVLYENRLAAMYGAETLAGKRNRHPFQKNTRSKAMFDHTKLVVGEKYPTREGKSARFLGQIDGEMGQRLAWAFSFNPPYETVGSTNDRGGYSVLDSVVDADIVSDQPIREPVEVTLPPKFINVWERQDGERYYATVTFKTKQECDEQKDHCGHKRVAVYELPPVIKVQPV